MAVLIAGKIIFKTKFIIRNKGGQFIMIIGVNAQKDKTIIIYVHLQRPKIHEAKTDRLERRSRQFNNNSF